ncbi:MAG: redoxin domain-containing protein [Deltaproteobacteria bacterium]|nr:redoxin domain-containing protein [Deltaproteobacteria bacterium]
MPRPYFFCMKINFFLTALEVIIVCAAMPFAGCAAPQKPYSDAPVDFEYEMQGQTYALHQLRGKPLLLVMVRTSEVTNEMHLDQIQIIYNKAVRHINVLVLSIAPNEAPMLDMFVEFHDYPFHIGMAPWRVTTGQSDLGILPNIPLTYFIDENGRVTDLMIGATNAEKILKTLRRYDMIP